MKTWQWVLLIVGTPALLALLAWVGYWVLTVIAVLEFYHF